MLHIEPEIADMQVNPLVKQWNQERLGELGLTRQIMFGMKQQTFRISKKPDKIPTAYGWEG